MVAIVVPLIVAFSRLYRGMHHPTDVIGSMIWRRRMHGIRAARDADRRRAWRPSLRPNEAGAQPVPKPRPSHPRRVQDDLAGAPMTSVGVIAHAEKRLGEAGLAELREALARYGINDPLWEEVRKSKQMPDRRQARSSTRASTSCSRGVATARCNARSMRSPAYSSPRVLPAGTANLFATNLGLPQDLEECVRIGLDGERRSARRRRHQR